MSEYDQKALEFLNACPAELEIHYAGTAPNHLWNDTKSRDRYSFVIRTQKGIMSGIFWDSLDNTKKRKIFDKAHKKPGAYEILSCLQKYDVGSLEDFVSEFGYVPQNAKDFTRIPRIYRATAQEYEDLCRIFTPEQLMLLREIY